MSVAALTVLSPVLLVVGVAVKLEDGGPVLYRTLRVGMGQTLFSMLKFRTMVVNAEQLGGSSTADDDPRVTRVGRSLRRWKIDEVPQLVNVLRGDMSLVGPRPQVPWAVERYTPAEEALLTVRPGMTDWASIAFRDEGTMLAGSEDPDLAYDQLIHPAKSWLGLEYVRSECFRVDVEILVKTALAVLGANPRVPSVPVDVRARLGLDFEDGGTREAVVGAGDQVAEAGGGRSS